VKVKEHILNLPYLIETAAPLQVIVLYYKHLLNKGWARLRGHRGTSFGELMVPINQQGQFSTDWFDCNACEWMKIIESEGLGQKPIEVLEIGSWEGKSTSFLLHYLTAALVTAVDTWQGSDEHVGNATVANTEKTFDTNVSRFQGRVQKIRSKSYEYFATHKITGKFDLIYVDGSHHADDVMIDAIQSFAALKEGGILVFDDYTWRFYKNINYNPAAAINYFLKLKRGEYTLLNVTQQVYLKKLRCPPLQGST
jgi:SAM-dependent methyltransferase